MQFPRLAIRGHSPDCLLVNLNAQAWSSEGVQVSILDLEDLRIEYIAVEIMFTSLCVVVHACFGLAYADYMMSFEVKRTHRHFLDHVVGRAKADLQAGCKSDGLESTVSIKIQGWRGYLLQAGNVVQ